MKVAIIGRSSVLYNCARILMEKGYSIPLIVTCKEAPEYSITSKDFEKLAKSIGAKFIYTPMINESEIIENIKKDEVIDIAVSINYSGVISQDVIDLFRLGIMNAHGGDLPKYRGNACQAWAIINGEDKIGLCVHKMIGGELDSGPILARSYINTDIDTKVGEVYEWMERETPHLILNAIKQLERNVNFALEHQSKVPQLALRCYPRHPSDGKIEWKQSNVEILRLINASSEPFAGAFTTLNDQRVIIWRAKIYVDDEIYLAVPGQIASMDKSDGSLIVITGNGKLKIEEITFNGERQVPAGIVKSIRWRFV